VALAVRDWAVALPARLGAWWKDRSRPATSLPVALWRLALAGGFVVLGFIMLILAAQLLSLLGNPLG
jgi:hypothetical protein